MDTRTAQQRSDAARQSAATARARRAAGMGPLPGDRRPRKGQPGYKPANRSGVRTPRAATSGGAAPFVPTKAQVFAEPKPTYRGKKLVALSALEEAFVARLSETGATEEIKSAYATYKKVKALALGVTASSAAQVEADTALGHSLLRMVKLSFL